MDARMVVSRFILLQQFLENSISIADDPRTFYPTSAGLTFAERGRCIGLNFPPKAMSVTLNTAHLIVEDHNPYQF